MKSQLFTDAMAKQIFVFDKPMSKSSTPIGIFRPVKDVKNTIKKQNLGIR